MNSGKNTTHPYPFFDCLPDDVVSMIFDEVHDARSLCVSMSVCKRFLSLVPHVRRVFLAVPRKKAAAAVAVRDNDEGSIGKSVLKNLVSRALMKPFNFLSQMMFFKPRNPENVRDDSCSFHAPGEILKPFGGIRELHLRLPCYGFRKQGPGMNGSNGDSETFLKWKAEFGSRFRSCVILGAKSWSEKLGNEDDFQETEHLPEAESGAMDDREMKLRIVWAISCLMAASARRYLIQETVRDREMIQSVVVSDESNQGKLCMNRGQIEELKDWIESGNEEGVFPALRMKMWYADRLQLSGCEKVMEGATLVVIRPRGGGGGEVGQRSSADLVAEAFSGGGEDKAVGEFATMLMVAKKCVCLEMNSF